MHPPFASGAFPFAVLFVSVTSSKLIHLYLHLSAVSVFALAFFLPTVIIPDVIIISVARLLLRRERGLLTLVGYALGCILTLITLGAAASQWGFFYETGGELQWQDAGSFANNEEGIKVLLSGSRSVLASAVVILLISWFARNVLYRAVGQAAAALGRTVVSGYRDVLATYRGDDFFLDYDSDYESGDGSEYGSDSESEAETGSADSQRLVDEEKDESQPVRSLSKRKPGCGIIAWSVTLFVTTWIFVAALIRPIKPYRHISTTLPVSLLDAFRAPPDICAERKRLIHNEWPLPELIDPSLWQGPKNDFKGWAPGPRSRTAARYRNRNADWFPNPPPDGFLRWDPQRFEKSFIDSVTGKKPKKSKSGKKKSGKKDVDHDENPCGGPLPLKDSFYNPVDDPLKITNLDTDLVLPLKEAIDSGSVKIKHVIFILMESMREELFPIQQGSDIHGFVMETHDEEDSDEINRLVSEITPNTERITGKAGNFVDKDGNPLVRPETEWKDQTQDGFGGLNVVGAFSPSSVSTKSIAASHCGVWPMPVEMFEEAETSSYQPCMPQILSLFNQLKSEKGKQSDDYRERPWHSAFFQAVTDTYDRQNVFDKKMGFTEVVNRNRIRKDTRKTHALVEEVNYFGYPDTALKSYIDNFITNVTAAGERMFLSHFTSTTHHPWDTPDWFETTKYMGTKGRKKSHKDFNKYLNSIRFHDTWLGEVMQLLDEHGIANETLVVFSGDHGQAFKEDVHKTGTYENGHVSNFRIPITFRHPHLPRYQYEANATSISVLPTILDLLISTGSLNAKDTRIASDVVYDYEGQSLIRPYKTSQDGRRAWNFGIVNSGGGMLTVTSADAPWRLVMPIEKEIEYTLTDLRNDPLELDPLSEWTMDRLVSSATSRFGEEAAQWATEAEVVSRWWGVERQRLWRYHSAANETKS